MVQAVVELGGRSRRALEAGLELLDRRVWLIPAALFGLNLLLKLHDVTRQSIWVDEATTMFVAQQPIDVRHALANDATPPVYYLLISLWMRLFGVSALVARSLSALLSSLSAALIFLYGSRFIGRRAGLIAALLFSVSTIHFYYAQEARCYALVSFLCLASFYCFARLLDAPSGGRALRLTLLNAGLVYTHYVAGWAIAAQLAAALLLLPRSRPAFPLLLASLAGVLLLFAPWLDLVYRSWPLPRSDWLARPDLSQVRYVLKSFAGSSLILLVELLLIAACLWRTGAPDIRLRRAAREDPQLPILLLWAFLPIGLDFVVSWFVPMFLHRYLLYASLGLLLLVAHAAAVVPATAEGKDLVAACLIGLSAANLVLDPIERPDWRKAVEIVKQEEIPGTRVAVVPREQYRPFAYYYDLESFRDYRHTVARLARAGVVSGNGLRHLAEQGKTAARIVFVVAGTARRDLLQRVDEAVAPRFERVRVVELPGITLVQCDRSAAHAAAPGAQLPTPGRAS